MDHYDAAGVHQRVDLGPLARAPVRDQRPAHRKPDQVPRPRTHAALSRGHRKLRDSKKSLPVQGDHQGCQRERRPQPPHILCRG